MEKRALQMCNRFGGEEMNTENWFVTGVWRVWGGCVAGVWRVCDAHYILKTPKSVLGMGALRAAERERPRTWRVWAGSIMPSSQSLALE